MKKAFCRIDLPHNNCAKSGVTRTSLISYGNRSAGHASQVLPHAEFADLALLNMDTGEHNEGSIMWYGILTSLEEHQLGGMTSFLPLFQDSDANFWIGIELFCISGLIKDRIHWYSINPFVFQRRGHMGLLLTTHCRKHVRFLCTMA